MTKPLAALIVSEYAPEEPFAYGSDAGAVWSLLKAVDGWACVDAPSQLAEPLGRLIEAEIGAPVQYYADLYHALLKPVERHVNEYARRLTLSDAPLIKNAPAEIQGAGYESPEAMLTDGRRRRGGCGGAAGCHRAHLRRNGAACGHRRFPL